MMRYPWAAGAPQDDASFPEVVVELQELTGDALMTPANSKLRRRLNRFRNDSGGGTISVRAYRGCPPADWADAVGAVVTQWAAERHVRADAYVNMLAHPAEEAHPYVLSVDGKACGFYLFEPIGAGTVGCYANLCVCAGRPGLTEAGLYAALEDLQEHGVQRVNLGGSEQLSLHRYKLKFGGERRPVTANLATLPTETPGTALSPGVRAVAAEPPPW
ncbi:phosphatidylglycerol lysyltransferase domain-containing protein [Streptomyces sp. BA2]|uniref:phosphatidylglycerol lysyltransferase domain-containing protein n=1 Tax=Streptomyces sp. BA2 TaxID=436595 RepID=UPI001321A931|nr:phosphatidylglycerol lysyltransferase domain-containing protein [Streptomyces sp. BA2]MWA16005.1 DUF2156 domain-containing protein [Streptomyces sp. BA2]